MVDMRLGQVLLENSRDKIKLEKVRKRISQEDGGIFQGIVPNEQWGKDFLGDTYHKVVLASLGITENKLEDITAMGGWCAIRTKDIQSMSHGKLDVLNGNGVIDVGNEELLKNWLMNSVTLEQIVESIGYYRGKRYFAISEIQLWTEKVISALELHLGTPLHQNTKRMIASNMEIAEEQRIAATRKYLKYIEGGPISLEVAYDRDIFEDLVKGRDLLLNKVSTSLDELTEPMFHNRYKGSTTKSKKDEQAFNQIKNYVDRYSLVWFMYTGEYLKLLKNKGYIKTTKGVILEPWTHALSNESEGMFNYHVFAKNKGINNYSVPGGINENLSFIALQDVSGFNWKQTKVFKPINQVPNILNIQGYLKKLSDFKPQNLDLANNLVFMDAINYLPYGETKSLLVQLINTVNEYRDIRKSSSNKMGVSKENYLVKVQDINSKIIVNLSDFYNEILSPS